jgi:hypothetical protein
MTYDIPPGPAQLIPWSRVPPGKLTAARLDKKFPAFHGTWGHTTMFTSAHHWYVFWAKGIQSRCGHHFPSKSVLILPHLRLGLPSCLFPSCSLNNILNDFSSLTCTLHVLPPLHSLIYHLNNICRGVQIMKLLTEQPSSASCCILPLRFKHSAPCSQTPLVYVLLLMWEIKFHIHKTTEELNFCIF